MGELSTRDRLWLGRAAISAGGGFMYGGCIADMAPRTFASLERRGLVRLVEPSNQSHKARYVATASGHAALKGSPQ